MSLWLNAQVRRPATEMLLTRMFITCSLLKGRASSWLALLKILRELHGTEPPQWHQEDPTPTQDVHARHATRQTIGSSGSSWVMGERNILESTCSDFARSVCLRPDGRWSRYLQYILSPKLARNLCANSPAKQIGRLVGAGYLNTVLPNRNPPHVAKL